MTISIHHSAICESQSIGGGTRIWAFTHILPGARIGADCNICDFVFVENDVQIGNRVTIKSGVQLWDGVRIEDDVFIGPNVSFTNDKFPRSRQWLDANLVTTVMRGASIGAGSTILPGITIGERAMIGAGSVVTKSVPPFAIVFGNPAKINGYVQSRDIDGTKGILPTESNDNEETFPGGSRLIPFQSVSEDRGALAIIEFSKFDAFFVKRVFFINQVPAQGIRGEHAHRTCSQFLIALAGELSVSLDDGLRKKTVVLGSSNLGLLIPPMTWSAQYDFSPGSVLAVLASHEYDENDYLRDYAVFKAAL
jgi:UDP-2-acetamido-3-amino-2,3-dideoxy-glucuronate N-acetyltransferase